MANVKHMDALVLTSGQPDQGAAFYRALGLPLEEEDHGEGPLHWACELGPVHLAIFAATEGQGQAPARRVGGSTQVGFQVTSLSEAEQAARAIGATFVVEPQDVPWGRRFVVLDPDGRAVELNQART